MNEIELKKLYDKLQGKLDVGTFDVFKSKMSNTASRKRFYDKYHDKLSDKGFNLGNYTDYEKRLSSGGGGNTTGLPEWAKCLESSGAKKKNDNVVSIVNSKGNTLYFSKSGKFQYTFTSKPGTANQMGNWRCNGTNGYLINMDNGDRWDGTKWIEGSQNTGGGGGNSSSDENSVSNGIYTTKGDPYQYKIVDCVWYTKGKAITDWESLKDNKEATDILDGRFPNARKKCKENKPEEVVQVVLPDWATCLKGLKNVKLGRDSKGDEIVIKMFETDSGYFWNDFTFLYVSKEGGKVYGKWSCKNNSLVVTTEDGQVWMPGSGWSNTPDKTETPDTNFDPTWLGSDEFSLSNQLQETLTKNESAMDNLENIINEVNSLIIEQTQQIVQAPKDELDILTTNPFLKGKGTLVALCRSQNGTSRPVNVNGKIYFAARQTYKKTDTAKTKPFFITYDGMILEGGNCKYNYSLNEKTKRPTMMSGVTFSDLDLKYTDILKKFGINPKNYDTDPYHLINSISNQLQKLAEQGALSTAFSSWNDMLTYYHPNDYEVYSIKPKEGSTTLNPPVNKGQLDQYYPINGREFGFMYNDKDVVIYFPQNAVPEIEGSTGENDQYSKDKCEKAIKTYLSAVIRYATRQDTKPNSSVNNGRYKSFLQGCWGSGVYEDLKIKPEELPKVNKQNKLFTFWRGKTLNKNNVYNILAGKEDKFPAGQNPYLPLTLDGKGVNESKSKLDKLIKENLQKLSEEKNSNLLSETKIIQTRTKILTENRILKFKQPREKFFNELISEAIYLESQGFDKQLIKEEFWDTIKGMFGQHGSEAIFGTFKEYMGKWLLKKLTPVNPEGWIGSIIVTAIGNLHIDDISKLTDCNFVTKKLASSIGEGIARKIQHDKGYDGGISDVVRNGLFSAIDNSEMVKSLESGLAKLVCPALSGVKTKLENKANKMKTMALQA
jgi:hypothetical protein